MSLEELKNDWESLEKSTLQNEISNERINLMLKPKYRSFINRILIFETIILLTYLYFIALTIFRFDELKIFYLEILGIFSIGILAILFIIRLMKLITTFRNRFLNYSHLTVLKKLAKREIRIQRFYLTNIVLGFILIIILIILNIKIYNEFDLIQSNYFWLTIIPSSLIFIVFINKWIRKYYSRVIKEAEDLLQELE